MIATGDDDTFEGHGDNGSVGDPDCRTPVVIGPALAARLSQEAIITAAHEHPECAIREG